jgi:RNA polymerase sigma-70 factor (ECF subfamily)
VESDAELVARIRRGDLDAFSQLSERYEKTLLALAVSRLRDFHAAEDVVQASLLLAFRRLDTLRDEGKFSSWLMQIAHRQVVEMVRAQRMPVGISLNGSEHGAAADAQMQAWIENEHLLSLVARLPEPEALLIGLRYFDGHNIAQIAAILARPVGTVTKQLSRAVARLRAWSHKENVR